MENKDILIMCQFFYPEYVTSSILPFQTAQSFVNDGKSVDVFCGYPKEYTDQKKVEKSEVVDGIRIKRLKYFQLERGSKLSRLVNYFSFVFSMFLQLPKMKKYKVIVVYSNPPILPLIAVIASHLFNCKIIFVAYDLYPEIAIKTNKLKSNSLISKIMNKINDSLYKRADVVALSNEMKEFIVQNRKIKENRVHVIPNWATEEESTIGSLLTDFKNKTLRITYLGNMGIAQDFNTLLKALNTDKLKNQDVEIILAGHGNKVDMIKNYVSENNLTNVQVLGYQQGNDLENLINSSDAFFLSLKDEVSGLAVPSKFYTYLLKSKPIVAVINKNTDISKTIDKFTIGVSVEEGQYEQFADQIVHVKNNFEKYTYSNIYSKYFSKKLQLNKYNKLVDSILEGE